MRTPELHLPSWDCSNMKEDTEWSSGGPLTMCQLTYHFQGRSHGTNRRPRCYCLGIQQVKKHITFIYVCVYMCVHMCYLCVCMHVRAHVHHAILAQRSEGNLQDPVLSYSLGSVDWTQVFLPAEPSCWPLENIFECQVCMSFHVNVKSINAFKYLINKVQKKSHSSRCLSSDEDKKEAK